MLDTEGWRLIGVNAQLFGSSLPREDEQNRWLDEQLVAAAGRPIALFLHKPLFLEDLNEGPASAVCIVPQARASLVDMLHQRGVRLVVSGHLHEFRDRTFDGLRHYGRLRLPLQGRNPMAATPVVASRRWISPAMESTSRSNDPRGWSRTIWRRSRAMGVIDSCVICRHRRLCRPTEAPGLAEEARTAPRETAPKEGRRVTSQIPPSSR